MSIFYHKTSYVPVCTEPLHWFASHLRSLVIVFECVGNCPDRPLESSPFALLTTYFIQDMMPSTVKQGAGLQNENYVRLTVSASSRSRSSLQFQTGARFPILLSFSLARCQIFVICSRRGGKALSLKVAFDLACTCFSGCKLSTQESGAWCMNKYRTALIR